MCEISTLIFTAFSHNPNRASAEQELISIVIQNPNQFRQLGQCIITQDANSMQIASILNAAIIKLDKQIIGQIYKQTLFEIYTSTSVSYKCKLLIKQALLKILQEDEQIVTAFNNIILNYLRMGKLCKIVSIHIFKLLFDSLIFDRAAECQLHCGWFVESIDLICAALSSADIDDDPTLYISFFEIFEECVCILVKYDKQQYLPFQNVVFQNKNLSQLFANIFSFQSEFHLIYCQNKPNVEKIKQMTLKCYKYLLVRMFQSRNKEQQFIFPIYQQHGILLPHFIKSLCFTVQDMVTTNILQILTISASQPEYYDLFQSCYREIIELNCYQCLIFSNTELLMLQDDPQGFHYQVLDFDDDNKSTKLHYEVLRFIKIISKQIDGALSYLVSNLIILFKSSINDIAKNQINVLSQQELIYLENQLNKQIYLLTRLIFANYDSKQRLQAAILILISLCHQLQQRPDIQIFIQQWLKENLNFFMCLDDQLLQILFCKLVEETSKIFINIDEQFLYLFLDQIKCACYKNKDAYFYQAIQTLGTLMKENSDISKYQYFDELIIYYSAIISITNDVHIFQLIDEWIIVYKLQQQTLATIAKYSIQRIEREQNNINQNLQSQEINIDLCWNLLIQIVKQSANFEGLVQIEQQMIVLYRQFYQMDKVQYSDNLIQFITLIISKLSRVTLEQSQLLPAIERLLKQQGYAYHEIFELMNNYIYYGREFFLNDMTQMIYFRQALDCLISTENSTLEKCEGVLLIQLGIQCLRSDIKETILKEILEKSFSIITQNSVEEILTSRVLCIFLSAYLTVRSLSEKIIGDSFQKVNQEIFGMNYTVGYDTKLFIIFYCNAILQNPNLLIETGSIIVSMLSYQMEQENENKWYHPEEDFENDDELVCDEMDQDEESKALEEQITKFKSGYVGVDEFETFKLAIQSIKAKHPKIIEQFKQSLHAFTLVKLTQILNVTRAQYEKPRQILKINKRKTFKC